MRAQRPQPHPTRVVAPALHTVAAAVALAVTPVGPGHWAHAQTVAPASGLTSLAAALQQEYEAEQAAVAAYLAANPTVQREVIKDGVLHRIVRIGADGQPIWIKSKAGRERPRSNVESGQLIKADALYPGGSLGVDITGQNMLVGVWEPGVPRKTHELLAGKVTIEANQLGSTTESATNHATHVTGTIVGKAGLSGSGASARGVAYSASALNWDSDNDTTELATLAERLSTVYVSNHSYGYANDNTIPEWQFGAYDSEARRWDEVISAATYLQPFVAAGNEQQNSGNPRKRGYDLMTGASAAKNVMTVGAVNADRTMSSYSNWGPTDDGRLKPEIVARGTGINSAQATSDTAYSGSADDSSGTSYATPAAAAGALLLQQYYMTRYGVTKGLKNATLRALLMGTADDLGRPGPDHQFGWGLMNVEAAAQVIKQRSSPSALIITAPHTYLARDSRGALIDELEVNPQNNSANSSEGTVMFYEGSAIMRTVVARGGVPLVVNLAWNDDAGTEQTSAEGVDPTASRGVYDFEVKVVRAGTTPEEVHTPWVIPTMAQRETPATKATTFFQQRGHNFKQVVVDNPVAGAEYQILIYKHWKSPAAIRPLSLVVTGLVISNASPEVRGRPAITGTVQEGSTLSSSYTYWDHEDDPEGTSRYRWGHFVGSDRGTFTAIAGATARTYTPVASDVGKTLRFCVTPVASTGTNTSTETCSATTAAVTAAPANTAPTASAVAITGTAQVGQTLTGGYTYTDAESDPQGSSVLRWLRGNTTINAATTNTYAPVADDVGSALRFCVTPVALTGTAQGTEVCSSATSAVAAAPAPAPEPAPEPVPVAPAPSTPVVEQGSNTTVNSGSVEVRPTASNTQAPGQLSVQGSVQMVLGGNQGVTVGVQSVGPTPAQIRFTQTPDGTLVPSVQSGTAILTVPSPGAVTGDAQPRPVLPIVTQPQGTEVRTPRMVTTTNAPCSAGSTALRVTVQGGSATSAASTRVEVSGCPVNLVEVTSPGTPRRQERSAVPGTTVHDASIVYPGEEMVLDGQNRLVAIQLGSTDTVVPPLVGTGIRAETAPGLIDQRFTPRLQGTIQRLNQADLAPLLTARLQALPGLSEISVLGELGIVLLTYEGRQHLFRAIGRLHVNTDLTPRRAAQAQGGVVIDAQGIAMELVPGLLNSVTLSQAVAQGGGTLSAQADGSYLATVAGVPHALRATTHLGRDPESMNAPALALRGQEVWLNLPFGFQQTLVPAAADLAGLLALARALDAQAQVESTLASIAPGTEVSLLANSGIDVTLNGVRYRLQPEMALVPVPAARTGQRFWQDGGRLHVPVESLPGWAQAFSVR